MSSINNFEEEIVATARKNIELIFVSAKGVRDRVALFTYSLKITVSFTDLIF
jgi:hypothetical protein